MRQPLVAPASTHDRKSCCAGPIDKIADQGRLIAIGEAVDHTMLSSTFCKQWATEGIRLNGDIDHMLAMSERKQAVINCSDRMARALHDDIHTRMSDQGLPVIAHMGVARRQGRINGGRRKLRLRPAHTLKIFLGLIGR